MLLGILILGISGTSVQLILLKHVEGALQLIPFAMLAAAFVTCMWARATACPSATAECDVAYNHGERFVRESRRRTVMPGAGKYERWLQNGRIGLIAAALAAAALLYGIRFFVGS